LVDELVLAQIAALQDVSLAQFAQACASIPPAAARRSALRLLLIAEEFGLFHEMMQPNCQANGEVGSAKEEGQGALARPLEQSRALNPLKEPTLDPRHRFGHRHACSSELEAEEVTLRKEADQQGDYSSTLRGVGSFEHRFEHHNARSSELEAEEVTLRKETGRLGEYPSTLRGVGSFARALQLARTKTP